MIKKSKKRREERKGSILLEIARVIDYYRYTIIKVENKAKKVKDYGKRGDTLLSDMIERLLNYYESKEGKPQKKLKI